MRRSDCKPTVSGEVVDRDILVADASHEGDFVSEPRPAHPSMCLGRDYSGNCGLRGFLTRRV